MGNNIYIAKQPILNKDAEVFAYELLYRDTESSSNIKNRKEATVSVLSSTINRFGIKKLLGGYKAFVKADKEFILHKVVTTIPKENFIFSLQCDDEINPEIIKRIEQLYKDGYTFAINDAILDEKLIDLYKDLLQYIRFIKTDINTPIENLDLLKDLDIELIVTKVEDKEKEQIALKMGAKYLQGYFFCKPEIQTEKKLETEVENVMRLCNKLMQDCSIDELVQEFEKSPIISIQLLKFINSGLFHFRQKLSSIKQVVTLVGKTKLTQWLMLMIYSAPREDGISNLLLFERVRARTYLIQEIAKLVDKKIVANAYFVGVISLMDLLLHVRQRTLLQELHVDKEIKEAILKQEGTLGEILSFVIALEEFDTQSIEKFIQKYEISQESLEYLTLNASGDLRDI